jgi:hypothetical protein
LGVERENQFPKVFSRLEDTSRFEPALQTPANPRTHQHKDQRRVADQERYEKYAAKNFDHVRDLLAGNNASGLPNCLEETVLAFFLHSKPKAR